MNAAWQLVVPLVSVCMQPAREALQETFGVLRFSCRLVLIYKDFNTRFGDSEHPELQKFNTLRNALEHKYVKVHSGLLYSIKAPYFDDDGTYHISDGDLQKLTIELAHMVRELIIDLSMAVHIEEQNRRQMHGEEKIIPQITLQGYDDEWKI